MKAAVTNNFSLLMMVSLVVALIFPVFKIFPDTVPPAILAVMMLFSCATIDLSELKGVKLRKVSGFYIFRFLLFPLILYGACSVILPDFRYAVLLLALLPAAVSAASLAIILEGSSTIGLAATVVSSFVAPFLIPTIFGLVGMEVDINILGMFKTLCAIVFLPAFIYAVIVRPIKPVVTWARGNAAFVNVLMFSAFILVVVSKLRDQILADVGFIAVSAVILGCFFFVFYALGWVLFRHEERVNRISYTLFSGCMNIGLGISLALLYFPPREKLYLIICEFIWVFSLSALQYFLKWHRARG